MKYISFAIPCYNSAEYMEHAIQTILVAGEDVEILIVNDGSSDATAEIGRSYEEQYPTIVRLINKENGGHGDAVNTGLMHATGLYYKVVDSDDWVNEEALKEIMALIRDMVEKDQCVDMILSNYVYEKVGVNRKKVIRYSNIPTGKVISWEDMRPFQLGKYILMHSVMYRTALLRECGIKLPKHTFYVDNIYVYYPLPYVQSIYYLDVDFYRYYIGREGQSVNEKIMIGRIDQQLFVTKNMIDMHDLDKLADRRLCRYMRHYLEIMMTVSSILAIRSKKDENLQKKKELWDYLKEKDYNSYKTIRYGLLGIGMNLSGKVGRKIASVGYLIANKLFGFQ